MTKVSIGIVTYNSRNHIDRCLESVSNQTYQDIEVVIWDNASPDKTGEWIGEHWSNYRLIRSSTNLGFGCAHNRIIALSAGSYYMPLNPDVRLTLTYIEAMVQVLEATSDIGWVAGKLLFMNAEGEPSNLIYSVGHAIFPDGYGINIGFREPDREEFSRPREVFGANAAAPLYRRRMLDGLQVRPGEYFDHTIFLYGEDIDLDWRARLLGWRCVYTPDAIGYHVYGASGGEQQPTVIRTMTAIRYYTAFKYAFCIDLLTYNLPAFILHTSFMLVTEPARAVATIVGICTRLGEIVYQRRWLRQRRKMTRFELRAWFDSSRQQKGMQASSYLGRAWERRSAKRLRRPSDAAH